MLPLDRGYAPRLLAYRSRLDPGRDPRRVMDRRFAGDYGADPCHLPARVGQGSQGGKMGI